MPAKKPLSLHVGAATKTQKEARAAAEAAVRPGRALPKAPPAQLAGHAVACATWRELRRLFGDLQSEIVTKLDANLLVTYCLLIEQLAELDTLRAAALGAWKGLDTQRQELEKAGKPVEALKLALEAAKLNDGILKIDARCDRKRALIHQLSQSLYITPRARAGVAPVQKPPEEEKSEMELLFEEVEREMNSR